MNIEHKNSFIKQAFQLTVQILLVAIVYFFTARLGLHLATLNQLASPVWPATGIALFFVLLWGPWMVVGVFLGAFFANYLTHAPMVALFGIGIGNALEAWVGVWLFQIFSVANDRLGPHGRLISFVATALFPTAIGASLGSLSLLAGKVFAIEGLWSSWLTWWVGDALGALILFPVGVKIQKGEFTILDFTEGGVWKIGLTLGATILSCIFVFITPQGSPFLFVIFLTLLLATIWCSVSWTYLVSILICAISILSTKAGLGPFSGGVLNENLLHLQLFLAGVGLTAIVLGALRDEGLLKNPSLALVFGWLLTGMTFYSFYHSSAVNDRDHFTNQVEKAEKALHNDLRDYIRLLETGSGLFAASDDITHADWKAFTSRLHLESQYPGINGIGVVRFVADAIEEQKLIKRERRAGTPHFNIYPVTFGPEDLLIANPPVRLIVNYNEPMKENGKTIGLLMSSERHRLEGALRARDTGLATMTDQVVIIQQQGLSRGFVLFLPFYKKQMPTETLEQRRAAFQGLIFSTVTMEKFVQTALHSLSHDIDLKIFFGKLAEPAYEMYSSTKDSDIKDYTQRSDIQLGESPVVLLWKRSLEFKAQSSLLASWVGFCGALVSIFLAILLSSLESLTVRAQKIAEEKNRELTERERLWRILTDSSPVGIYLCDDKTIVNYMNGSLLTLLGRTLTEILAVGWHSFLHPEDKERVQQDWQDFKAAPEKIFCVSFRFVCDTRTVYVTSKAVALRNEQGHVTGFVGTIQDMTELQLKQMALIASSRMSSLGEMAGGVAHEINNPLAIILGKTLQLEFSLKQNPFNAERVHDHIRAINSNVERIAKIIKGLRTIARDVPDDPIREVYAKDIIQDTLELCRSRFKHHEVSLFVPKEVDENLRCLARPEQIVQVLLNLLNNAFDAVSDLEEKWVRVEIESLEKKVQFSVTDSGKGLRQELMDKAFIPFFTTKEVGRGTGLGLSISRGIIEKHDGRLYIDEHSANTKFIFELNS